jgi:hypothetical protein
MSSARSLLPLRLNLRPSRYLGVVIAVFHLLGLISLWVCSLPLGVKLPLAMAVLGSFALNLTRYGNLRRSWFIEQVCHTADGRWLVRTADGREHSVRLLRSYVHPVVLILQFSLGRFSRHSVVVLPDSADPEEIRRLRVWLRTAKQDEDRGQGPLLR